MSDQVFELAVRDWLEDGSDRTPPAAIDAVLLAVKTTPQERVLRIPPRFGQLSPSLRLATALVLVASLGAGAILYIGSTTPAPLPPTPSPTPTASPSPAPTFASIVDTSDWVLFASERYGFDIKRPPDWSETAAERNWTLAEPEFPSPAQDWFEYKSALPDSGIIATAWSVAVEPGTSAEAWIDVYCPLNTTPCDNIQDGAEAATMDGHPGSLVRFLNDVQAFFLVDNRMYVVAVWRAQIDQSTTRFTTTSRLVRTFVSTMSLRPGGPVPGTSDAPSPAAT